MNLFEWIRNGVRQAVLLGVSDAVGDIGQPPESEDMAAHLLDVIRNTPGRGNRRRVTGRTKPKRLGRGLTQVQTASEGST